MFFWVQKLLLLVACLTSIQVGFGQQQEIEGFGSYKLIAHRGGVVNEQLPENSMAALNQAIHRGYYMVEVDVRLTKDSVLITHHDGDFKRYYGEEKLVSELTWKEIQKLEGSQGQKVLQLEEVFATCQGKIKVMIDNKISGFDKKCFTRLLSLLDQYQLRKDALMIGTEASTEFFTGKVKLSCTRQQLEENQKRPDYNPDHYYLFSSKIDRPDVLWARQKNIDVVAAVNAWALEDKNLMEAAKKSIVQMKEAGVTCFQIDSQFERYFYK